MNDCPRCTTGLVITDRLTGDEVCVNCGNRRYFDIVPARPLAALTRAQLVDQGVSLQEAAQRFPGEIAPTIRKMLLKVRGQQSNSVIAKLLRCHQSTVSRHRRNMVAEGLLPPAGWSQVCSYGHPYSQANTYIRPYDKARLCRKCRRDSNRVRMAKVRGDERKRKTAEFASALGRVESLALGRHKEALWSI